MCWISIVLLGSLLLVPVSMQAQEEFSWDDQVAVDIGERVEEFAGEEWQLELKGEILIGSLDEAATFGFDFPGELELEEGGDYVVLAVCDADCHDIDLYLYGPGEAELDRHVEDDKVPVLEDVLREKSAEADYRIELYMVTCDEWPCYFAVGVYERTAAEAIGQSPPP